MRARKETKWNAEAWENEAKNPRATAIRMTKEEAERDRRGWLNICGGKPPFKMEVLELEKDEEK